MNATPDSALLESAKAGDPHAQTRVGIGFFSRGQHAEAFPWLERASQQDVPEACNLLGLMYLNGIGLPHDPTRAVHYLERAAARGLKEACYTLGNLQFNGVGTPVNEAQARANLLKAAGLRHLPALRTIGMLHCLANPLSDDVALPCLRLAAQGGDGFSQYVLATLLLERPVSEERAEGLYWLQQAASRRIYCAVSRWQSWLQQQSGGVLAQPARMTRPQIAPDHSVELSIPDLQLAAQAAREETLAPGVLWQINNVLPPLVCDHFMNLAMPALTPSYVIDPDSGKALANEARTSSSMYLRLSMYDFITGLTLRRIAELGNENITHAEPLAVMRYSPGQEYKEHFDYFTNSGNRDRLIEMRGGQRNATLFVYLNDVEQGGETDFPLLHACVSPKRGKAVKFLNLDAGGQPNTQMLHAGKPVIRGEKWLLTVWFRQRTFVWGELKNGSDT